MSRFIISILLLFWIGIREGYSQTIDSTVFVDIYWGDLDPFSDQNKYQSFSNKNELYNRVRAGMIFHSNGTFEEIPVRSCGFSRKPFKGTWQLKAGVIEVKIYDWLAWKYKVLEFGKGWMKLKYWIEME